MGHLKNSKRNGLFVSRSFARAVTASSLFLGISLGAGAVWATAQADPQPQAQQAPAPTPQPPGDVARMSSVQGKVQVRFSGQNDFEDAVMNMPLLSGAQLQTGSEGQAEVEFNDGSVARLTPNSSLQLKQLTPGNVDLHQLSGLGYYELNVGPDHPSFNVEFANATLMPTANLIFRLDLDKAPEAAVISGSAHVEGAQIAPADIGENQSIRFSNISATGPYTVTQGLDPDSWDQWNSDRDQAIAQEAAQQTPVRNDAGSSNDENWNDLDYYGNWYPVPDYGNVWVPTGVDAGWDPFGLGYWGYYPGFGATWISGYPWGWLPYRCGGWNYFSFGWGWVPGGCGLGWAPIVRVRGYPGYFLPARPNFRVGGGRLYPVGATHLYTVDRGGAATGPWSTGHFVPGAGHQATVDVGGHAVSPIGRATFPSAAFARAGGTSPGVRAALANPGRLSYQHAGPTPGPVGESIRAQPSYSAPDTRSTYLQRAMPAPHYNAPHYSPPPVPHASVPSGGAGGRR
jgi:hypothetical protein